MLGCLCVLAGCAAEPIVHMLGEREANLIVELLAESDIAAQKMAVDTGRSVSYTISVSGGRRIEAIRLLNLYELPRRAESGYVEIFKDGGLIPTAGEEKAKQLAALEGEIEKQLRLVDRVLDVQVQIVQPEENALRTAQEVRSPVTASVTLKYLPGPSGKPLTEPQVQAVVANGVERLTPDNVVVVMTPASSIAGAGRSGTPAVAGRSVNETNVRRAFVVVVVIIGALVLALIGVFVRMQTVSGRFARLQAEIARARKRPTPIEGGPPPPA